MSNKLDESVIPEGYTCYSNIKVVQPNDPIRNDNPRM